MQEKKYILIAEDDSSYRNIFETKIPSEGFDVFIAKNGKELIASLESRMPNLILLDIIMPELDGFETLKYLKTTDKFKNIPVVILSSLGQKEDMEKVKLLGASEYLVKGNISISELILKIKNYLIS